jgi:NADPH2:quinone reductase
MLAIAVNEYGGMPAVTQLLNPEPGRGQVLIRIKAAGVNPLDQFVADGALKEIAPATFPLVLGADLAGVVETVGDGAARFSVGERVFGQLGIPSVGSNGSYAEYVAVGEDAPLAHVPDGLELTVAAALPTAGVAALQIVESLAPLAGKTVLLVGAAGGVGSFATQYAVNDGAHVIAVAKAADERLLAYGAAEAIDYTTTSVAETVRQTHPDGIDVLIDLASDADGFAALASLVRSGGTALKTRFQYAADIEALASRGVVGVNFEIKLSSQALERLAKDVVSGRIAVPPITVIAVGDVPRLDRAAPGEGKTVIAL